MGDRCVWDGAGLHSHDEACTFRAKRDMYVAANEYHVEPDFDFVTIGATPFTAPSKPVDWHMPAGTTMTWTAGGSVDHGFEICGSPAPADRHHWWEVVSGGEFCEIKPDQRCVWDGAGPHGNSEACTFRAKRQMRVTAYEYHVEPDFDFV